MQATPIQPGAALTAGTVRIGSITNIIGPALVRCSIPSLSALAAGETVTLSLVRDDTGAVIGGATFTNSGAGASAGGPLMAEAYVPAGQSYPVSANIIASVATGNWVASATQPAVLSVLP